MARYSENLPGGIGARLIKGAVWTIGMRMSIRLMGLVSLAIVARLLLPEDFGIFAVVVAIVALLQALTDIGPDLAIIRHPNPQRSHYDTAWTISVLVHLAAAGILTIASAFVSDFFDDGRYGPVVLAMAASLAISGFKNIGIADFRRDLEFHKDFKFEVTVQLIGVVVTVVSAVLLRSYWALVVGVLTRSLSQCLLSYLMHPFRPKLSLVASSELVGFSFWTALRSIAYFTTGKADLLIVGKFYTPTTTGWYAVSADLASMAVSEILHPIGRALFPGLARMQNDPEWNKKNLKKVFNVTATISVAIGVGFSAVAEPTIALVYGERFRPAGELLSLFALASVLHGFSQPIGQYLVVINKVKDLAILVFVEGLVLLSTLYFLASRGATVETLVLARMAVASFILVRLYYLLATIDGLTWRDVLVAWSRPIAAAALMYGLLTWLADRLDWPDFFELILLIPVGMASFSIFLFLFWHLFNRPAGIEEEVLARLLKRDQVRHGAEK